MVSYKYELDNVDWKKVGIGAGVAVAGAVITYVVELIPQINFGDLTPLVVAASSVIANMGRKFLTGKGF